MRGIMKKSFLIPILTLLFLSVTTMAGAEIQVNFPDSNLEAKIRDAISKPTGTIYGTDLEQLTYLNASYSSITNLTGLEYCINLISLNLYKNQISDISPLAGLTNLISL
jgi:Leucine-rich repeat (LRR) protein